MARQLLKNEAAEQEANDVAFKFMNSADVVGDMKRAYTGRLDRVRLHDDDSADAKVSAAGRDGIASGSDIYLKKGLLSDSAPETKGLIAHEMTHIMQQSGGESTQESVSYGEEQGGIRDWFKSRFGKKEEPAAPKGGARLRRNIANDEALTAFAGSMSKRQIQNLEISEPTLQTAIAHGPERGVTQEQIQQASDKAAQSGSIEDMTALEGLYRPNYTAKFSGLSGQALSDEMKWQDFIAPDIGTQAGMVNRELAHDPAIQQRALNEFIGTKNAAMRKHGDEASQMAEMRNDAGTRGIAHVLTGLMPENFLDGIYQWGKISTNGMDTKRIDEVFKNPDEMQKDMTADYVTDAMKMSSARDVGMTLIQGMVDREGSEVGDMLTRAKPVFEGTAVDTDDKQSAMLMNMLMNRVITPAVSGMAGQETDAATEKGIRQYSQWMMKAADIDQKKGADDKHAGFMQTLKRRFHKK
ncbi:MAG: DUF4157 domain-containing protein [Lachnospiraceae bacterium]|nr:DUF4157 domain-containing protein [Lachnospiraceae bacterium]